MARFYIFGKNGLSDFISFMIKPVDKKFVLMLCMLVNSSAIFSIKLLMFLKKNTLGIQYYLPRIEAALV